MARSAPVRSATRSLVWLAVIIAVLAAVLGGGALWSTATWTPKLGTDLAGGTEIILAPQLPDGQTVTQDQLDQSVSIIRQRIDAAGVSEAQVASQGGSNVVVTLAGIPDDATLNRIQSSARLTFRCVIQSGTGDYSTATPTPTDGGAATGGATATGTDAATPDTATTGQPRRIAADTPTGAATDAPTDGTTPTDQPTDAATAPPSVDSTDCNDDSWVTPAVQQEFDDFNCNTLNDTDYVSNAKDDEPYVACDNTYGYKYLLGPVEVSGEHIANATAGLIPNSQGTITNQWGVFITFDSAATPVFSKVTTLLYGAYNPAASAQDPKSQFAIVLDGWVIEAPTTQAPILDGKPVISGSFTQDSSKSLADQLKFGALPISFTVESSNPVSASLGQQQLLAGLIAGGIGLLLVLIYSLFQYRLLGLVTFASLVLMGGLTYLAIALFSWQNGYRLSLAGIAGLIVSIGFTADSFIVFFERIRDELRDGKGLAGAVESGWKRALRTILSAKFINLLSAVVLFLLAAGNVQGFAFTLGLTTVIDVVIVLLFTHPMLQLLAENRFFASGHPITGLDPNALGAVYRGRAEFRISAAKRSTGASREAQRRQTIAERKAAAADSQGEAQE